MVGVLGNHFGMRICKKCRRGECDYRVMRAHIVRCYNLDNNNESVHWIDMVEYSNDSGAPLRDDKLEFG